MLHSTRKQQIWKKVQKNIWNSRSFSKTLSKNLFVVAGIKDMLYSLSKPNASIQDCLKGMKPTKRLDGIWVLDQRFICNRIPFNSKCYLILLMWALRSPEACHLLEELCNSFSKMTVQKSPSLLINDPEGIYWVQRKGIFFSLAKAIYIEETTQRISFFSPSYRHFI